jgi:putative ABC transport system substrate-binding protein
MRRRDFIGLTGVAATWPLAARGRQTGKLPAIGFFGPTSALAWTEWTAAFVARMHELGWDDGRTVAIAYRWGEGHTERFGAIAADLVRSKPDLIVTSGGATSALMEATHEIPIVFALAVDPVGAGFVANLAHPGGNVTGMAMQTSDLAGKRIELLHEAVPGLRRVAILADLAMSQALLETDQVEAAARTLHFDTTRIGVGRAEDVAPALTKLNSATDGLYVCTGPLVNTNRVLINSLALEARIATMHSEKIYVQAGGLMSYGPNVADLFRRAAELADKVLRGAKPAGIPVEQPTKFELIVNTKTARALGLTMPANFLALADEVIE